MVQEGCSLSLLSTLLLLPAFSQINSVGHNDILQYLRKMWVFGVLACEQRIKATQLLQEF